MGAARKAQELHPRENDPRSPWQRDRARILHSAAFRRLQNKTQVLGVGHNDFYRTRLTHSLEVSQIGTGILGQLAQRQPELEFLYPEPALIESACLSHDIGHPPFGHGGEVALNYMMRDHGGFEGNAQTFRILTRLEPYTRTDGMNLCRRTLLSIMKYPALIGQLSNYNSPQIPDNFRQLKVSDWTPAKGVYDDDMELYNWCLDSFSDHDRTHISSFISREKYHHKTKYKSFDCSIMELADDIAYGVHDLEDAIVLGLVSRHDWQEQVASVIADIKDCWLANHIGELSQQLFSQHHYDQKNAIGMLVNAFITAIGVERYHSCEDELLDHYAQLDEPMQKALDALKRFVLNYVIHLPTTEIVRYKGQQIVMELFQAFSSDPERLLPINTRKRFIDAQKTGGEQRVIADYIAGMTDDYAQRLYQNMF
ncbi:deoxyguanosinetriphosphate triphosphohydrolase family protein [Alginatibacterium sediminis]|uniref:Deoxyguanosinetriphosphate triphosphohydrolase-like protein n=2 Tax=Alginatibacterium sediminis TaxID=2164068 RepID=A0A420EBX2_9ALTE|nr:anti-phage deoxyguanosine triphosphatase [Alginatibacterium sediminis]RKF18143.1 deoxyguanosinetriphosphate triphosphohydrolase family protein [Alginatibacterium sediminis]